MRIAFLGTPEFAVPSLRMLFDAGHELHLFTQPDRPVGRHNTPAPPPAKVFALSCGIPVSQFDRIKSEEGLAALRAFQPELMVTAAFGQMLSAENLAVPPLGCINVHGSLLPKYRGAAPIQWAVINGETRTGVTTMFTDIGMDTGDMLLKDETDILPNETAGELYERLSLLGAGTLSRTMDALLSGTLKRVKQDETLATKCPMLKKEHGKLAFIDSAQQLHNRVRGTNPWPGAFALLDGETLKIWTTRLCADESFSDVQGLCFETADGRLLVQCADRPVEIVSLQLPGGKRLDAKTFLRGHSLAGKRLL